MGGNEASQNKLCRKVFVIDVVCAEIILLLHTHTHTQSSILNYIYTIKYNYKNGGRREATIRMGEKDEPQFRYLKKNNNKWRQLCWAVNGM